LPLRFHPGDTYYYSYGLDVVGRVIEVLSKKPLDVFLRQELFEPLQMSDTGFDVAPLVAKDRLVALYTSPENREAMCERPPKCDVVHKAPCGKLVRVDGHRPIDSAWVQGRSCPVLSGGGIMGINRGGMVSSLADQTRFYMMLLRGGQLSPKHRRILCQDTIQGMWSSDWLPRPNAVGHVCREGRKRFGWHALGEIGVVRRPGHYPEVFQVGEWGMAGAAETHVSVDLNKHLLILWFTQNLEGWPGWWQPAENLWAAAREVMAAPPPALAEKRRKRSLSAKASSTARKSARKT